MANHGENWWQQWDEWRDDDWTRSDDNQDWWGEDAAGHGDTAASSSAARPKTAPRSSSARPKQAPKSKAKAKPAAAPNSRDRRDFERWNSDHRKMLLAQEELRRAEERVEAAEGEIWSLEIERDQAKEQLSSQRSRNEGLLRDVAKAMAGKVEAERQRDGAKADTVRALADKATAERKLDTARQEFKRETDQDRAQIKALTEANKAMKRDFDAFK
ncbi:unnamed protein product, partial [Symbiodinium sp. CCMP2456]